MTWRGKVLKKSEILTVVMWITAVLMISTSIWPAITAVRVLIEWQFHIRAAVYDSKSPLYEEACWGLLVVIAGFSWKKRKDVRKEERHEEKRERFRFYMGEYPVFRRHARPRLRQWKAAIAKLEELEKARAEIGGRINALRNGENLGEEADYAAFEEVAAQADDLDPAYVRADHQAREFRRLLQYFSFIELPRQMAFVPWRK